MEEIYGNTEMSEEEVRKILPDERKKEMADIRKNYIMQYEQRSVNW